ncbi:ParB N-terminal domain-containing protein [Mycolicibacter arupensis]|uniref:Uncharacterized protein n=1 Tax=Mycolicibacter arupensis TaxID=342002 RepID=A0A0F5MUX7_9MYCO|nr:ParB N-terminal domain-containing protein [Mycolicibacter arupensis]KKB97832.1 hypothetical protein WR43_17415 [Mycolicibacter arupensis]MCV7277044.1 ParB N-terminal domain-containing protein [Mycolicibacter arupensis]OQZ91968.1 hypothetical protein BST15_19455 [Mycolicibacter arupensis]
MMSETELNELASDIRENGQREPITLTLENYDEAFDTETYIVVDGRNRYEACIRAGVEPLFSANLSIRPEQIGPWIISQNIHRRHLTASQRAMIALEYERVFAAEARERQGQRSDIQEDLPECSGTQASDQAGQLLNVSGRSVRDAKFVAERDPEAAERIRRGEASVSGEAKSLREKPKPAVPAVTPPGGRPGATQFSRAIQKISASIAEKSDDLSDEQVAEALGAAQFLYELLRGETIIRKSKNGAA